MLPGFRFLFAAVVLSMSILVFGFGAAALLRTAHEEFANTPSWQPAPETRFAQTPPAPQPATQPVLAMLRVDDPPKDAPKQAANTDQPAPNDTVTTGATDQPAVAVEPASQPDKIAALQPADSTPTRDGQTGSSDIRGAGHGQRAAGRGSARPGRRSGRP